MRRARRAGDYRHKRAGTAPAKHRNGRGSRWGEAWAVGAIGIVGLVAILYASSLYAQW